MSNVLFFTHSLSGGGAEKTVRNLSNYFNSHNLEYKSYVCVVYDDEKYHDQVENLIVLKTKSNKTDKKLKKAINVLKQIREVKALKKKLSIDICVSFLPGADIINVLSGVGEKKIVSVRNKESLFTHNIFKRIYVKTSYILCDRIVAVSEVVRQDVISFFGVDPDKVVTIHNAIDEPDDSSNDILPEIEQFMAGHRVIINVGRLAPEKGQEHLIRAFSEVNKKYPDTRLLILGEGELRNKLELLVNELGLEEYVLLPGRVDNTSMYLKKAELFVLSSIVEGMPNVLLEALQQGLPCISTECGAREILAPDTDPLYVTDGIDKAFNGILVPNSESSINCEEILEKAMITLLSDKSLRSLYSDRGNECVKNYRIGKIIDDWKKVFTFS